VSQRGYGDPPYQREDEANRRRQADARDRLRPPPSPTAQPPADFSESWDREARPRPSSSRWSGDAPDDRHPSRSDSSSRPRWSSETSRRGRRTPSARPGAESFPPREPSYPAAEPRQYPPVYDERSQLRDYGDEQQSEGDWVDDVPIDSAEAASAPPARRHSRLGQRMRSTRNRAPARPTVRPSMPTLRVPGTITRLDILQDQVALALFGTALVSTVVMAGILAGRVGSLPDTVALRFDAVGDPTRWGPPESLWQLPLLAAMVTVINAVLAGWVSRYDRFASRFVLASAVVIGLLAWIPLVRFLW
jgi:hypothetical protein